VGVTPVINAAMECQVLAAKNLRNPPPTITFQLRAASGKLKPSWYVSIPKQSDVLSMNSNYTSILAGSNEPENVSNG
jgi:hypothetical protein